MTDSFCTEYRYRDGLILIIPEWEGGKLLFTVTSDSYALLLSSGTQIRIGMKADELQKIFPSSFMKRKPISDIRGKEGKISFIVNLASKIDNQTLKEDAWIRFIMNPDTGLLEEFYY